MFGLADRIRLGRAGLAEGRDLESKCREREVEFLDATGPSSERPDPAPWQAWKMRCIGAKLLLCGRELRKGASERGRRGSARGEG